MFIEMSSRFLFVTIFTGAVTSFSIITSFIWILTFFFSFSRSFYNLIYNSLSFCSFYLDCFNNFYYSYNFIFSYSFLFLSWFSYSLYLKELLRKFSFTSSTYYSSEYICDFYLFNSFCFLWFCFTSLVSFYYSSS
jgi:hypothetical protein